MKNPQVRPHSVENERKAILRELRTIARKLAQVPGWYVRRRDLLRRGRQIGIFHRELAEASGISEAAVIKDVKPKD